MSCVIYPDLCIHFGSEPEQTNTYNNGVIDVPAKPSKVVSVDEENVQESIIDSGYWPASKFTRLP